MALTISVEEASSHLNDLLSQLATSTEEIIISREGTPIARLLPVVENTVLQPRIPGCDKGKFQVPAEFFEPLPEEWLTEFYGAVASRCK